MKLNNVKLWIISALLLVTGCGGGGNGRTADTTSGQAQTAFLFIDSATGSDTQLTGTLDAVALERADGELTGNLLRNSSPVVLADVEGQLDSLRLTGVADGDYVAMHLLFQSGMSMRTPDGRLEDARVERRDHRVELEDLYHHDNQASSWLVLRHQGGLDVQDDSSGDKVWTPHLACRRSEFEELRGTCFKVVTASAAQQTVQAMPNSTSGDLSLTFTVPQSAILTSSESSARLSLQEFFNLLVPGTEFCLWGSLDGDMNLQVEAIQVDDSSSPSSGIESKVVGNIESLDSADRSFQLQVLRVIRGGAELDASHLPVLTVLAGNAEIFRSGLRFQLLDFNALKTGALVEVEWDGPVVNGAVRADEVEIEDEGINPGGAVPEIEGQVGEVLPGVRTIVMVPRKDDPLIVNGQSVASLRVRLAGNAFLFRADDDKVEISLNQVGIGERIWVKNYTLSGDDVLATVVRIRMAN